MTSGWSPTCSLEGAGAGAGLQDPSLLTYQTCRCNPRGPWCRCVGGSAAVLAEGGRLRERWLEAPYLKPCRCGLQRPPPLPGARRPAHGPARRCRLGAGESRQMRTERLSGTSHLGGFPQQVQVAAPTLPAHLPRCHRTRLRFKLAVATSPTYCVVCHFYSLLHGGCSCPGPASFSFPGLNLIVGEKVGNWGDSPTCSSQPLLSPHMQWQNPERTGVDPTSPNLHHDPIL